MRIGDPKREDQRGLIKLSDNPTVVLPGYRRAEIPDHLADHMVEVLNSYSGERGDILWPLASWNGLWAEPPIAICGQTNRLFSRVTKCGIPDGHGGGIWWRVLVEPNTGVALVAGSRVFVI